MSCAPDLVHLYCDGMLDDEAADRFREHLAGCRRCQDELHDVLQISLQLQRRRDAQTLPPPLPSPPVPPARWRRWARQAAGASIALAAAMLALVLWPDDDPVARLVASSTTRPIEARLARGDADRYRPF